MVLPLKIRLFGAETGQPIGPERLVLLDAAASTIVFDGVTERPVLSIKPRLFGAGDRREATAARPISPSSAGMMTIRSPATRRCSS